MRRAHDALKGVNTTECANCGELKLPHHVCNSCGFYASKEILGTTDEVDIDEDAA